MWSRAYLHPGGMNGVTTGIGGVKRRFAGAQRSSSHILHARKHMIEVFVQSRRASYSRKMMSPNPRETAQEPRRECAQTQLTVKGQTAEAKSRQGPSIPQAAETCTRTCNAPRRISTRPIPCSELSNIQERVFTSFAHIPFGALGPSPEDLDSSPSLSMMLFYFGQRPLSCVF